MRNSEAPHNTPDHTAGDTDACQPEPAQAKPGGDRYIRVSTIAVVVSLAGAAFYISYRHLYDLAISYGEGAATAQLVPLTVDVLIIAASLIMLHCARAKLPVPPLARFTLGLGIAATLTANAAHGIANGWAGSVVSAFPAVALVLAYELLMWLIRTMKQHTPEPVAERVVYREVPVEVEVEREVRALPADRFEAARWAVEDSYEAGRRPPGRRALADRWGIEIREAVEILDQVAQERVTSSAEQTPHAVELTPERAAVGVSSNGSAAAGTPTGGEHQ